MRTLYLYKGPQEYIEKLLLAYLETYNSSVTVAYIEVISNIKFQLLFVFIRMFDARTTVCKFEAIYVGI